ncbi:MAG: hypothetical protein H0U64_04900 [Gemmatimonadaceae bacterium]|nr:hypothetical protein [Gemmatimonadaceae bacterium]
MTVRHQIALVITLSAAFAACSSTPAASPATVRTASPDYITSIEVEATPVSNLYDLVNRLRPRWLQAGNQASIGGGGRMQVIAVYLDGTRMGDISSLRAMSISGVKTLRFYDAARAATILRDSGKDPLGGAIVITTNRVQ